MWLLSVCCVWDWLFSLWIGLVIFWNNTVPITWNSCIIVLGRLKPRHRRCETTKVMTSDHENDTFCMEILINTLRLRQNGPHFPDNIFKCIFFNKNVLILLKISLKFVPSFQISNILALVQMMAWHLPGDKPLSEPMMVSLLTHICVTLPEWVMAYSACMETTMTRQHWIDLHNAKSYQWMTNNGFFTWIIYHIHSLVCHINHITECMEFNSISIEIVHL